MPTWPASTRVVMPQPANTTTSTTAMSTTKFLNVRAADEASKPEPYRVAIKVSLSNAAARPRRGYLGCRL